MENSVEETSCPSIPTKESKGYEPSHTAEYVIKCNRIKNEIQTVCSDKCKDHSYHKWRKYICKIPNGYLIGPNLVGPK